MNGIIYKITNKINGKSYIGQTVKPIEKRYKRHIHDAKVDNYALHRAISKYGVENFEIETLETVSREKLDEREIYWIKKFNTHIFAENSCGYNMTTGGDSMPGLIRKLTPHNVEDIREKIKNTELTWKEIAKPYGVSEFIISDINNGKAWYDENIKYPIRPF